MDKYEFKLSLGEINRLIEERRYGEAADIADTIDWNHVGNADTLRRVSEVYKAVGDYDRSRDVMAIALKRQPDNPAIIYGLCELTIFLYGRDGLQQDLTESMQLMTQYQSMEPSNPKRLILQYKFYKVSGVSAPEKIQVLEQLRKEQFSARWGYELAKIYAETGNTEAAAQTCRDVSEIFGGKFGAKAQELLAELGEGPAGEPAAAPAQEPVRSEPAPVPESENRRAAEHGSAQERRTAAETSPEPEVNEFTAEQKAPAQPAAALFGAPEEPASRPQPEEAARAKAPAPAQEPIPAETGRQASINEVMAEWERIRADIRRANDEKRTQRILEDTGSILQDFDETARHSLLEDIEKGAARQRRQVRSGMYRVADEGAPEPRRQQEPAREEYPPEYAPEEEAPEPGYEPEYDREPRHADEYVQEPQRTRDEAYRQPRRAVRVEEEENRRPQPADTQPYDEPEPADAGMYDEPEPADADVYDEPEPVPGGAAVQNEFVYTETEGEPVYNVPAQPAQEEPAADDGASLPEEPVPARRHPERDAAAEEMPAQTPVRRPVPVSNEDDDVRVYGRTQEIEDASTRRWNSEEIHRLTSRMPAQEEPEVKEPEPEEPAADAAPQAEPVREPEESVVPVPEPQPLPVRRRRVRRMAPGENPYPELEREEISERPVRRSAEEEPAQPARRETVREENRQPVRRPAEPEYEEALPEDEEPVRRPAASAPEEEPAQPESGAAAPAREEEPAEQQAGEKRAGRRELTKEERRLFGPFCRMTENVEQLTEALDSIGLASSEGNLLILGNEATAERVARGILEIVRHSDPNFTGRVAKATGESLNRLDAKGIAGVFSKLENGSLIVTRAADIAPKTLERLHAEMEQEHGLILIFTDGNKRLDQFRRENAPYMTSFTSVINIRPLDDKALVAYAKDYARSQDYSIDEFGQLALAQRISSMQTPTHHVTLKEVRDLVDEAIGYASRKNPKVLMEIISRKRYDEDDRIILHEKDFTHY